MPRILIVDDDPIIQLILENILRKNEYAILKARDGQAALELLIAEGADLVITDIFMPNMNGLALLEAIREDGRYARVPVIVLTAAGQARWREQAEQLGVNHCLTKPFSSTELLLTVQEQLRASRNGSGTAFVS